MAAGKFGNWDGVTSIRRVCGRLASRAIEREFEGANSLGLDRVSSDGLIERFVWLKQSERSRPRHGELEIIQFHWNVACVLHAAGLIRAVNSRPTQHFAVEIEFLTWTPFS